MGLTCLRSLLVLWWLPVLRLFVFSYSPVKHRPRLSMFTDRLAHFSLRFPKRCLPCAIELPSRVVGSTSRGALG